MTDLIAHITEKARAAKTAAAMLAVLSTAVKNRALRAMADAVSAHAADLVAANARDVEAARRDGRNAAFVDRLTLTPKRVDEMAKGLREVADNYANLLIPPEQERTEGAA
ncbi:MAG: hypothetical protein HY207_00165 [Nitrospirae bacterium]|nr:hypothetical protein [Nitrospirota bacterium]